MKKNAFFLLCVFTIAIRSIAEAPAPQQQPYPGQQQPQQMTPEQAAYYQQQQAAAAMQAQQQQQLLLQQQQQKLVPGQPGQPQYAGARIPVPATQTPAGAAPGSKPGAAAPGAKPGVPGTAQAAAPATKEPSVLRDESTLNLDSEEAFIDRWDALKSKQYVHRVVLSAAVQSSSRVTVGRPYVSHVMGFSNVWQQDKILNSQVVTQYAKYVTGVQGLTAGYVFKQGHAVELGLEVSGVSNVFLGYRYFFRNPRLSLWPFLGAGGGMELDSLSAREVTEVYGGSKMMGYATLGIVIPLVDVGLRAEARFNFYGADRWILTQGIGATIFF